MGQAEVADQARGTQAELGWVLHPDHAGRGYATEAVRELLRLCFTELGPRRVTANCFADNTASWRLLERVGMRREAYAVVEFLRRSGEWLDTMATGEFSTAVDNTEPQLIFARFWPRARSFICRSRRRMTLSSVGSRYVGRGHLTSLGCGVGRGGVVRWSRVRG